MIEVLLEAERALSFGLLDQAERLYRQAADADPRNSIAVVGLARVALERGDEERALAEAERALTIDPENEAARRTAQRLREVLAHRAASAPRPAAPEPAAPEPDRAVLTPTTIQRAPEPASAEPARVELSEPAAPASVEAPVSVETPDSAEAVPESEAPVPEPDARREPKPDTAPDTAPETAPEPPRRGGIIGWLLRLFGRR